MTDQVDCVVIGAGIVGLACARALALAGHEVIILEAADNIGTGVSSRNSEVIHAGIYYPPGSLKATLCREGKNELYEFCRSRKIPHKKIGKIIIATSGSEVEELSCIKRRAQENGVTDLTYLTRQDVAQLEPDLDTLAGLYSPSTGIVDSHQLMLALLGEAENAKAMLAVNSTVVRAEVQSKGLSLQVNASGQEFTLNAKKVINAAGLDAALLLAKFKNFPITCIPTQFYCKGTYFSLNRASPFKHLIYPVPNQAGLGVHVTLDLGGQAKFGPDTEWVDSINYDVDESRSSYFLESIRKYWPDLEASWLEPDYTGIRPKLACRGQPPADFYIQGSRNHGVNGLINLMGIESPGLTACLAIASRVCKMI